MLKDLLSLPMAGVNDSLSLAHPPDADSAPQHHGVLLPAAVSRLGGLCCHEDSLLLCHCQVAVVVMRIAC